MAICDQVDLIVCYDASASPIRNIQRMGRTGRHRQGRVVCILAAGTEEQNYHKNLAVSPDPDTLLLYRPRAPINLPQDCPVALL